MPADTTSAMLGNGTLESGGTATALLRRKTVRSNRLKPLPDATTTPSMATEYEPLMVP
jgi:hypothetical protein